MIPSRPRPRSKQEKKEEEEGEKKKRKNTHPFLGDRVTPAEAARSADVAVTISWILGMYTEVRSYHATYLAPWRSV
jgi:hypothetical protein